MSELLPSLGFQFGAGTIGGFIVGYAVKKISKIVALIVGLFIIALIYLGVKGIISINYDALWSAAANSLGLAGSAFSWLADVIALLPFAGSFILGFGLGFKFG